MSVMPDPRLTGRLHTPSRLFWQVASRLFAPVDNAVLAYFRIVFGAIMLWEVYRYFDKGWIGRYWIDPVLNFTYYGFDWVRPLPGDGMYMLFALLGLLSLFILLGLWYRFSIIFFFFGFTYAYLLEQARYLNHFYLIILISFLMIFLPLHRSFSLDAWRKPSLAANTAPAWTVWLLRFQIAVPYFFGGVAKLNGDWLRGEPMTMWLSRRTDFPLIGSYFTEPSAGYLFSYGGLLLDLLIVPLLLWSKTRPFAFLAAVVFHLTNDQLFTIGIFPWFMIFATAVFFPPEWPRRLLNRLNLLRSPVTPAMPAPASLNWTQRLTVVLLLAFVAAQCLLPLRHLLYAGDPGWTEEGHRYSWRMKLRGKSGSGHFVIRDPVSATTWEIDSADYLPRWQNSKMLTQPHMILQFAHFLQDEMISVGHENVEVYAHIRVSLNGRARQPLIDPTVDLTEQHYSLRASPWILPLTEPLRREAVVSQ
jgi:vitamin K-dependent gamma-carboxylase